MAQKVEDLIGDAVYDTSGDKIGKVKRVYVDNNSGAPTWAAVSTGLFSDDSLVPLAGAQLRQNTDELQVRVRKDAVKSAPHLERDGLISQESEEELFVHYGIDPTQAGWDDYGRHAAAPEAGRTGTAAGMTGTARDDAMVRSEERLDVGTQQEPAGKARLRKYVVTEQQSVTVPTTHEEVRVEREPITESSATSPDMGDEEREVTLHEDRVTVNKETVPVEKVGLAVDEVEDEQTVSDNVRKERIDAEGTGRDDPRRR
ncbi:PRC and DUF2382 domain-containing protein [Nocardia donostiensis]|uniref:Photosystem reaction center subunit H n=1 Tax=Nocardia donostiensis TaxID=1538463 RepID=A0A1W0AZX8_9NOCA|nr:PRC and DUF2382 domain-containing protein [Nocardia donostiensis]ONM50094.1 hypothetical protein B0T46_03095 [Nocardia donostiensis]OQS15756.1 hypothetical protein B0T36_07190 [Nocardia donostiensis]OQS23561.1 hypothetical protein B0T44_01630 [Nocardia donostiensis]